MFCKCGSESDIYGECVECFLKNLSSYALSTEKRHYDKHNMPRRNCFKCKNEKRRIKYLKRRLWINKQKSKKCVDCHIRYNPWVMQFDHLRDKCFTISSSNLSLPINTIKEEISKCEVVCANCHAERTYQRRHKC